MKVPSRRFALAGLVCEPREKAANVVQGHVVKHPLGVMSMVRGGAWSDERWTELGVIDEEQRASFIAAVSKLRAGKLECGVPEFRGGKSTDLSRIACDDCPTALATGCAGLTTSTIGGRYLGVLEEVLDAASSTSAVKLEKAMLGQRLFGALRTIGSLGDLVVGFAGLDARNRRSIVVRLNRGDGVRAELYFEEPDQLNWRTLYRDARADATPNGRLQFLMEAPPQANAKMPLSDLCLVSRPFWQKP